MLSDEDVVVEKVDVVENYGNEGNSLLSSFDKVEIEDPIRFVGETFIFVDMILELGELELVDFHPVVDVVSILVLKRNHRVL